MSAISTPAIDTLPAEVLHLAEEQHVTPYLPAMLDMTRHVFPGRAVRVVLDEDPEIPDDRHIRFDVDTSTYGVDELMTSERAWVNELIRLVPGPLTCVFRVMTS